MSELFNFERHCLSPFFFLCVSLNFFVFRASYMNTTYMNTTSTLSFLLLRLLPCSPSQIHGFFFNYYCYMHMHLDTVLMQLFKGQRTHPIFTHYSSKPRAPEPNGNLQGTPGESRGSLLQSMNDLFLSPTIFVSYCVYKGKVLS